VRRRGEKRSSSWNSLRALGPARRCAIILRGESRCAWCAAELTRETVEIDHVVARALGGTDADRNLVPACATCNQARHEGALDVRLLALGVLPAAARAHVDRQIARPVDREAGSVLAARWYPWAAARRARNRAAQRSRDAAKRARRREAVAEGLGGDAFPFAESEAA
jgi:hypothetical protein